MIYNIHVLLTQFNNYYKVINTGKISIVGSRRLITRNGLLKIAMPFPDVKIKCIFSTRSVLTLIAGERFFSSMRKYVVGIMLFSIFTAE